MATRSWRWLAARILGLLTRPVTFDPAGEPAFTSRLQAACYVPPDETRRATGKGVEP